VAPFLAGDVGGVVLAVALPAAALAWLASLLARRRRERGGSAAEGSVVRTSPPDGVPAGLAGTLLGSRASHQDVIAALVDLAHRGYLAIEPVGSAGPLPAGDWRLRALRGPDASLRPYELTVLYGIFSGRGEVGVSDLRYRFGDTAGRVRRQVYAEVVDRGWYRRRPDRTRGWCVGLGVACLALAVPAAAMLGADGWGGIVGLGITVTGVALLAAAPLAPARTPAGVAVRARLEAFRRYVRSADPSGLAPERRPGIFARYLPYAVAFGAAGRWVYAFAVSGAASMAGWPAEVTLDPARFAAAMDEFTSATTAAMTATPAASAAAVAGAPGGENRRHRTGSSGYRRRP
jgi:Predicted membrane protein (DUF2207)